MTINIKRYIDITSGVGGSANARQRELIGLLFTSNPRVPVNATLEMESAADVAAYFGAHTREAQRANFYFDFISKTITRPRKIAFARYVKDATPATIYGGHADTLLDNWKAVNNGSLTIIVGSTKAEITALDCSQCASLTDVASLIEAAIKNVGGIFANSSVSFDALKSCFNFQSGSVGKAEISLVDTGANDMATRLGWVGSKVILSPGADQETPVEAFLRTAEHNNNFGSFAFIDTLSAAEIVSVAEVNSGRNVEFMYCVPTTEANAQILNAALVDLSGVCLTLATDENEFDEMAPQIVLASTDYDRRNGTQNYMFQQFNLKAKVDTAKDADYYDNLRVNYMGVTQTGGQLIKFYQRGVMTGLATAPVDMNTYANEMWFKDAAASALMSLLLAMPKVSANADGRGQVIAILQDAIDRALYNGTISVEKPVSVAQKLYISQMTGDVEAWRQVQSVGYWLDCDMKSITTADGRNEWKATYILIYAKDDVVRKIEGTHTLI